MVMILASCGSGPSTATNDGAVSQQDGDESQPGSEQSSKSLEELAAEEGYLTWYCVLPTDSCLDFAAEFENRFPAIKVNVFRQPGGPIMERLRADAARNQVEADVIIHSDPSSFVAGLDEGLFEPYAFEHGFPDTYNEIIPDGYPAWISLMGVAYNTNLVTDEQIDALQQSYDSLLDPAFSGGKIAIGDPSQSGSAYTYFYTMMTHMGEEAFWSFIERLGEQRPAIFPSIIPPVDAVVRGEHVVALVPTTPVANQVGAGAPISVAFPPPTPGYLGIINLVRNAPHPNAAKLFIEWFSSQDGQTAFGKVYPVKSPRTDVEDQSPLPNAYRYEEPKEIVLSVERSQFEAQLEARQEFLRRFNQIMQLQ